MNKQLVEQYHWFHKHAGYCVGKRAQTALTLARDYLCLQQAVGRDLIHFEWYEDDLSLDDLLDPQAFRSVAHWQRYADSIREVLVCVLCTEQGPEESLGGIIDPDPAYRKVVETELFGEFLYRITSLEPRALFTTFLEIAP